MLLGPLALRGTGAELGSFASNADGYAARVVVDLSVLPAAVKSQIQAAYTTLRDDPNLPADAKALLPAQFDFVIDQRFIETVTEATEKITQADAYLAKGLANFPTASSSSMGSDSATTNTQTLPSAALPILNVATGLLKTSVVAGPKVNATANLSDIGVALESVGELLPADLQAAFGQLVTAVNGAITTANGALAGPVASIASAATAATSDPALAPVVGLLPAGATPAELATKLQETLALDPITDPLAADAELASVNGLLSTSTAQQKPGKAVADAAAKIASINVLDGFLSVGLVNLGSHSEAAGTDGSARNTNNCSIADARLGTTNGVALDGKSVFVNGAEVPVATNTIGTVKTAVDTVLATAGIKVGLCEPVQAKTADDGTSASQTMSALRVEFSPPAPADIAALGISKGDPLIRVIIDPTVQTAVAARAVVADQGPALPKTGASIGLTVLIGAVLVAGSYMIWRRMRTSH